MNISFIIPSSDNLPYLKESYRSVREHAGDGHEIIILDDYSSDGTLKWTQNMQHTDSNLVVYREVDKKVGHTVLYNTGAKLAKNEVISILHADMFIGPNYVENILKNLKRGTVVSATRIEPPLHPSGKEKITMDFGSWPSEFKEEEFLEFVLRTQELESDKVTSGIFAPWAIYKKDYWAIGGHDKLFAPYPYEDSDIFQRFILSGYTLIQSRDALVYHYTCRGHKWTGDTLGEVHDKFPEYEQNARRNWFRKWGTWIENNEYSYPIMYPFYKIGLVLNNRGTHDNKSLDSQVLLTELEPMFSQISIDPISEEEIKNYIKSENTLYDLTKRIVTPDNMDVDVVVNVDTNKMNKEDLVCLYNIQKILWELTAEEPNAFGTYSVGNLTVNIVKKPIRNCAGDNILCQY